jgi:hypothetical protein
MWKMIGFSSCNALEMMENPAHLVGLSLSRSAP